MQKPTLFSEFWRSVRAESLFFLRMFWTQFLRYRYLILTTYVLLAVAVVLLWPFDRDMHEWITSDRHPVLTKIANKLRRWGDFRDTVVICSITYAWGALRKNKKWQRVALSAFLAACISGLAANAVRFTAGRPRPPKNLPDGFYGPTLRYDMQSFPSGHAATSTACGVTLLLALPKLGIWAFASALSVTWACLYSRVHYVTDVLVGFTTGWIVGSLGGFVARNREAAPYPENFPRGLPTQLKSTVSNGKPEMGGPPSLGPA